MLDLLKNSGRIRVLTEEQKSSISGGKGTCAYSLPNGTSVQIGPNASVDCPCEGYGVSAQTAQQMTQGIAGAHWCCDSCSSASWYNPPK
ncbi:hypothetical protein [Chryseobacterium taichungense]|uniref:hypothetical protein n=1 Tax=Chryseobacterium taichungense TaxID=295069 RepID=UPI0028A9AF0F|nr:hypothetical protein [Chryseobacterium taichungense]